MKVEIYSDGSARGNPDGPGGYVLYEREWSEDRIGLSFDMPLRIHRPEAADPVYDRQDHVLERHLDVLFQLFHQVLQM